MVVESLGVESLAAIEVQHRVEHCDTHHVFTTVSRLTSCFMRMAGAPSHATN
jgi:hypothetical protein